MTSDATIKGGGFREGRCRLGVEAGSHKLVVVRSRGWKTIPDCLGIQHVVVDNHPKLAVFFWREEYRLRVIGTTAPDDAYVEKSFDLTIKFRMVMRCHRIRPMRWWF